MLSCLQSTRVSVLINGSPSAEFGIEKGLRQGCSLSPFLFNIAAEGLHQLICNAKEQSLMCGIGDVDVGWNVSHLQYADDTLIFLRNDLNELLNIKMILLWFEVFSGLGVNYHKSTWIGVNISDYWCGVMASRWGCRQESLPFKYLGSLVGFNPRRISGWDFLVNNMRNRLQSWKSRLLSVAGRLTLVKAVLSSMPLYHLSIFAMPVTVCNDCEKIFRCFLWSGSADGKCFSKARWELVKKPVEFGGLGVGDLLHRNKSFMLKGVYQLVNGSSKVWARQIRIRLNVRSLGDLRHVDVRSLSPIWRDFLKVWGVGSDLHGFLQTQLRPRLGSGDTISFWADLWCSPAPLSVLFPRLFRLSSLPEGRVGEFGQWSSDGWQWSLPWDRPLLPRELDIVDTLHTHLVIPSSGVSDRFAWQPTLDKTFTIESFSGLLLLHQRADLQSPPYDNVWHQLVPHRISFFLWQCFNDCVPSKEFLCRRRVLPVGQEFCNWCISEEESWQHILMLCDVTSALMYKVRSWFGVSAPLQTTSFYYVWEVWRSDFPSRSRAVKDMWLMLFYAVCWVTWLGRNEAVFKGKSLDVEALFRRTMSQWYFWLLSANSLFPYRLHDLLADST